MVQAGSCYMTPSTQTRVQSPLPMASDSDSSFPNSSLLVCKIGVATGLSLVALTVKGIDVCQAFYDTWPVLQVEYHLRQRGDLMLVLCFLLFPLYSLVNFLGYSIGTPNPGFGLRQWPSCRG